VNQAREVSYLKALGKQLKKLRKEQGFTQQQLAFESGLELSQISRIERGIINTSVSQLFIICKTLEIHPKELFDFNL
jgi:transcriptional regulator with XRE-family HTH domain